MIATLPALQVLHGDREAHVDHQGRCACPCPRADGSCTWTNARSRELAPGSLRALCTSRWFLAAARSIWSRRPLRTGWRGQFGFCAVVQPSRFVSVVRGARARERPQETARALRALLLRCFRIFGLRGRWPSVRVEEECVRPSWRRARRPEGCAERPQHGAVVDAVRTCTRRGQFVSRALLQWLAPSLC
jgi:hypothetical protein